MIARRDIAPRLRHHGVRAWRPSRFASVLVLFAFAVTGVSACSSKPDFQSIGEGNMTGGTGSAGVTTASVTVTAPSGATVTIGSIAPHVGARTRLQGFGEVTITVTTADGQTRTWCLLLADTEPLREQGLMRVSDPALGGYDGMLFRFDGDTGGSFWMKNTLLPLSLAYLRADGTTRSTTDMAPCPATTVNCPTYPPGGSYRNAIEVPQGQLDRLGISDRSKVAVGPDSCPAAP